MRNQQSKIADLDRKQASLMDGLKLDFQAMSEDIKRAVIAMNLPLKTAKAGTNAATSHIG